MTRMWKGVYNTVVGIAHESGVHVSSCKRKDHVRDNVQQFEI